MNRGLAKLSFVVIGMVTALGAAELVLRFAEPDTELRYTVWSPGLSHEFDPAPGVMPGVEGPSRFTINDLGIRGGDPSQAEHRILAVGGSTTECLYLDDSEAWPARLEAALNRDAGPTTWVGNVGKSGRTADQHALDVPLLLDQHPGIRTVLVLVGINDLHKRLMFGERRYTPVDVRVPAQRDQLLARSFVEQPQRDGLRVLRLFTSQAHARAVAPEDVDQDASGEVFVRLRNGRATGEIVDVMPELDTAVRAYEVSLHAILDAALTRDVRPILMTQPALWHDAMSDDERAMLWMGGIGDLFSSTEHRYYSWRVLRDGLDRFNDALRRVAEARGVECLDLAAAVPKSLSSFYDDVHFNEAGAETVATTIASYLAEHPRPPNLPPARPTSDRPTSVDDLIGVTNWGPKRTSVGVPFNPQKDGSSSLWIQLDRPLEFGEYLRFGGELLETNYRKGTATASIAPDRANSLVGEPGEIELAIVNLDRDVAQTLGRFEVTPLR